jgi:hypothetical protein
VKTGAANCSPRLPFVRARSLWEWSGLTAHRATCVGVWPVTYPRLSPRRTSTWSFDSTVASCARSCLALVDISLPFPAFPLVGHGCIPPGGDAHSACALRGPSRPAQGCPEGVRLDGHLAFARDHFPAVGFPAIAPPPLCRRSRREGEYRDACSIARSLRGLLDACSIPRRVYPQGA